MQKANINISRRTIFDQAAPEYDEVRPGYPAALIEDVLAISAIPNGGRILEIGCGTGQATLPFAQRGYAVTCLDIGKQLAALAARKFAPYPNVQVYNIAFEDWEPQEQVFDLVMLATAFHWIPREVGYPKAAKVLKDTGSIAIFSNEHPAQHTGFFADVQTIYRQAVPEWSDPRTEPPIEASIQSTAAYIDNTELFEPVVVRTYPWTKDYMAADYLKLLTTYSDHRNLEAGKRSRLFKGIGDMIEETYGGTVTKEYLAVLYIAKKRSIR
jgi:SAM-dependent methyltransferase